MKNGRTFIRGLPEDTYHGCIIILFEVIYRCSVLGPRENAGKSYSMKIPRQKITYSSLMKASTKVNM